MGKNRLVYGENTEISYMAKIMTVFMGICLTIGVLLIGLTEYVFGGIALAAVLVILIMFMNIHRKQYQKVDGSFLYREKELSMHIDIYGKMRKKRPVVIKYGDKEILMESSEGGKFARTLRFMLDENTPCILEINRKKKGVTVKIAGETIVDNNYVRKEYLLPD